eukprot:TRINITY_DN23110_c0_g1_i1.p1 TRINITY_DN23110_c0_g1~~TRINITY_DN23110_c0_g1_i1.p1  ORF type:complete len:366 (-),score=98.35 TRINITY_DN23110_c0_g1_i1:43-1140(-)
MEKKAEKRSSTGYLLSVFAKLGVVLLSFLMNNLLGLSLDMKNLFKRSYDSEVCSADEHSNDEAESLFLKDKEQRGKRKRGSGIEDERVLASTGSSEEEASKKEAKKKKTQKDIKASLEPLDGEKSGLEETGKEQQTKKDKKRKEKLLEELYEARVEKRRRTLKTEESDIPANKQKLKTEDESKEQGLRGVAKVVPNNDAQLRKRKREEIDTTNENSGASIIKNASVERSIFPTKRTGKRNRKDDIADMSSEKHDECKLHHTVFVRNLPVKTKKKHLIREFSQFGEVQSVGLRSVPLVETKMPRKNAVLTKKKNEAIGSCHAYIVFNHEQSANAALSHNMTEFGGNQIRVDRAQPLSKKLRGENHL